MSGVEVGRSRHRVSVAGAVVGLVLVGIAGGWALRTMLAPAADVLQGQGYTLVTAVYGTVGQSLRLNVTAEWTPELVVANQATGTVTTVELDTGAEVAPGDPVYTVDLRPVVVAAGEVPAFRDLGHGSQGDDVAQVQELLRTLGHPVGPADGRFGTAVHEAVRAWQRDLGVAADGVVRRGDVVFVPALPARLALAPEVVVGAAVAGGEPAVQVLPRAPSFTITLPDNQARLVSPGTAVEMPRDDGAAWRATVSEVRPAGEGAGPVAVLVGVEGAPVCRDACDQVPVQSDTLLPGLIQVVPEESGVTVPAAALVTTAAGQTGVVLDSGQLRPVEVVASASGVAVVEGVEVGEQVRTPGEIPAESGPDGR